MIERKIVWILICTLISNSAYALIAPFLPLEFKEKGISGEMIGLMFAIYSVAVIVCSPCVGSTVQRIGNTNMISIGIATMGLAFILFGLIPQFEDTSMILIVGFVLRFFQGAASAFVQTTCYSIATNDFPDKKEQIVGWVEALTGLGLIAGPIIGSTLYSLLGYAHTFFIYGSFLVFLSFIIKLNFPGDDEDDSEFSAE
jgi:MFS family permease